MQEKVGFCPYTKNENVTDFHGNSAQGIGVKKILHDGTRLIITYDSPSLLTVGDDLYQLNGDNQEFWGNRHD
jgi:hypothetical protein